MRIRILVVLAALCLLGSVAAAVAGPDDMSEPGPTSCNLDNYIEAHHTSNAAIPDGSALVLGPLSFNYQSGLTIHDVVVGIQIEHPSVGDLILTLMRVHGSDVSSVQLLDRPDYPERQPSGCQAELSSSRPDAVWYFSDEGSGPMADGANCLPDGQAIPEGCYQVAPESPWPLALFEGLPIGGANGNPALWYLIVRDEQLGNVGSVSGWSIHLADHPPVSVESRSWGVVKSLYR